MEQSSRNKKYKEDDSISKQESKNIMLLFSSSSEDTLDKAINTFDNFNLRDNNSSRQSHIDKTKESKKISKIELQSSNITNTRELLQNPYNVPSNNYTFSPPNYNMGYIHPQISNNIGNFTYQPPLLNNFSFPTYSPYSYQNQLYNISYQNTYVSNQKEEYIINQIFSNNYKEVINKIINSQNEQALNHIITYLSKIINNLNGKEFLNQLIVIISDSSRVNIWKEIMNEQNPNVFYTADNYPFIKKLIYLAEHIKEQTQISCFLNLI